VDELRDDVKYAMACPSCGRQKVTTEQLARDVGLSLRTVSRFVTGEQVSAGTRKKLEAWLDAATA